ncbi:Aste57867_8141 [Aphanomyces stellatus]|uniref:Aste57867_8141 protein n=1 Tax=Aphanomyces stellatus TaxID=120398 RepID=A0A485KJK8_9STRA|nr:hypothetical protein As57867_008111 [Aphanomyces stellatus]VFT85030.1 Aste57867_8141 [Aphanomyces stellatus]
MVERPHMLLGIPTLKQRRWTLHHRVLTMTSVSRGPFSFPRKVRVKHGQAWPGREHGFQVETEQGEWLRAIAPSKTVWATWLQALQHLSSPKHKPQQRHHMHPQPHPHFVTPALLANKKVNFHGKVRVREIPVVEPDDIAALYYSEAELDGMIDEMAAVGMSVAVARMDGTAKRAKTSARLASAVMI